MKLALLLFLGASSGGYSLLLSYAKYDSTKLICFFAVVCAGFEDTVVRCYSTSDVCVGAAGSITIAQCCNDTTSAQKSYQRFGGELCLPCECK